MLDTHLELMVHMLWPELGHIGVKNLMGPYFGHFVKNSKIAHNSLLRAHRGLLRSFLDFQFFFPFLNIKSGFLIFFFENVPQFAPQGEVICDHRMLHFWVFSRPKLIFP